MTIQRLPPLVVPGIADGSGDATFRFEAVPSTHERWGVLTCPLAPASAVWTFFTGAAGGTAAQEQFAWNGNAVAGPILVTAMLTPIVQATGLVPGAQYKLLWHGYEGDQGEGEVAAPGSLFPSSAANTVQAVGPGGGPVVVSGGGSGSLIATGYYTCNVSSFAEGDALLFTTVAETGFTFTSDGEHFSVPSDSSNVILFSGHGVFDAAPYFFGLALEDSALTAFGNASAQTLDASNTGEQTLAIPAGYDSTAGVQPLAFIEHLSTGTDGPTQVIGFLAIFSYTTP